MKSVLLASVATMALLVSTGARSQEVANPICPDNTAKFNPSKGEDIVVPDGYAVSVFVTGINFPTGLAFRGSGSSFEVYVLESGHGLPSRCNEQASFGTGDFDPDNPFTPDILVYDQTGKLLRKIAKPTASGGLQVAGPAVDLAFEKGLAGGRLFVTDSNQATHASGQNNSSRIATVDPQNGAVTPFITALPTGDHPTEQLAFRDGFVYWSQGSTTNSGVVGLDNGGGNNQPDIPCQDITLSSNLFDSGEGNMTSGYSPFRVQRPGAVVRAFEGASHPGVCDGSILRARLDSSRPETTIEPFSWGYRNGYAIRVIPEGHLLDRKDGPALLVGEDGPDERGARPTNNAPDNIQVARRNKDGSPDYHGWPDRFGQIASSQAVYDPKGGPNDDLCVADPTNEPPCTPASLARLLQEDVPIRDVLAFPPQAITAPLAEEAADSSFTAIDFVPDSFVGGPLLKGAALYALEGDFGFSKANATAPAPEVGHEIKLINFRAPGEIELAQFAHNNSGDQAFPDGIRGFNRPTNLRFGPDGCAWIADYGAVRDVGRSDPDTRFVGDANAPLVQIPNTGVIWRICKSS